MPKAIGKIELRKERVELGTVVNSAVEASRMTLTIAAGITIHGQTGAVGFLNGFGGGSNVAVINQGTVASDSGGTFTLRADNGWQNTGSIQAVSGGTLVTIGLTLNSGTIFANVGSTIIISGDLNEDSTGVLGVAIAGTSASQMGQITVSGATNLNGALAVSFVNGFVTTAGQMFKIVTYASHTGTFARMNVVGLPMGLTLDSLYNSGDLTLLVQ
jgi:hypothetical protein